ncbi:ABC-type amino acid transport/signal transduction systems, periplasmic component/domain protein [Ketogulonicigenium robustum]|uniref:ABC-type amino acid transport/signal transduction systems, periplasmic component/domain protein n=1 Tax=Ketogulonicigenium robustum TaxID=92947 RepID=A0A1W6NYZ4_9RHOB|nr:transporter substrate-binding domain-containing protein [Ketogulonicigenium robustum]ARO14247.1 ABC-type amino acid transport/signal transduction systems, periplasmic component/domain protein [Ketogulonicigenium robustum]
MRALLAAALTIAPAIFPVAASAQLMEQVANPQLMNPNILPSGSQLRICHQNGLVTADLDIAIAREIAARLFLEIEVNVLPSGYGVGGEFAAADLLVNLSAQCDAIFGMGIGANIYPAEFTVTQPYVAHSFTYLATNPDYQRLTDIPAGLRVGVEMASYGSFVFRQFNSLRPESERLGFLPYADHTLMLTRLQDETLAAVSIYAPFWRAGADTPVYQGVHELQRMPELAARVNTGALLLSQNTFMRGELDAAIADLLADGTVARLIEELGYDAYGTTVAQ